MSAEPWMREVKVGDMLRPIQAWNKSERGPNRIPVPTEVLSITRTPSQSGIMFLVRANSGDVMLDAAWFEKP